MQKYTILVYKYMQFEFDPAKSVANKLKHGIDFETAKALWRDLKAIEIAARNVDEPRFLRIAQLAEGETTHLWSVVFTYRETAIRLISVRRSRANEVILYEGQ